MIRHASLYNRFELTADYKYSFERKFELTVLYSESSTI